MSVRQVPSAEVEIGMFVYNLDRPWLETPFPLQGFEVHTQNELDEIIRLTHHVFILEVDEKIEIRGLHSKSEGGFLHAKDLHVESYSNTVSAEEETKNIASSHDDFVNVLSDLHETSRVDGQLKMEIIEPPIRTMVNSVIKNADAYLWLTRLKKFDSFIYKDALTAGVLAAAMGKCLGLSKQDILKLSASCVLMDLGKLLLPYDLVHQSHRLSHEEWETMKTHVKLGADMVGARPHMDKKILHAIETHHERISGCGYPSGLRDNEIPLFGQVAGIIDQYVSVTNPRPFSEIVSPSHAEQMLYKQKGIHFDSMLVEYFIQTLSTYPTGTLVELSTGEVAIVKSQHQGSHLKPNLILLLDANKSLLPSMSYISLDTYIVEDVPVTIKKGVADGEYGINIEDLDVYN